jgi:hypothetical protein
MVALMSATCLANVPIFVNHLSLVLRHAEHFRKKRTLKINVVVQPFLNTEGKLGDDGCA